MFFTGFLIGLRFSAIVEGPIAAQPSSASLPGRRLLVETTALDFGLSSSTEKKNKSAANVVARLDMYLESGTG
jgi:hypothetical protein